jgi:hypothetical protein
MNSRLYGSKLHFGPLASYCYNRPVSRFIHWTIGHLLTLQVQVGMQGSVHELGSVQVCNAGEQLARMLC